MTNSKNCHAGQGSKNGKLGATPSSINHIKRKRPANPYGVDVAVEPRKCSLDFDVLDCPICFERFSPPVYQCRNGHTTCSVCCEKLVKKKCPHCELPTGELRCLAIERILDSLHLSCKYAEYGCREMLKTEGDVSMHEEDCGFEPFPCPSPECIYKGTSASLATHLAERHSARVVKLDDSRRAQFKMKSGSKFTLVKDPKGVYPVCLIHREVHKPLGDVIFCSVFRRSSDMRYNLRVDLFSPSNGACASYAMAGATVIDLRFREKEYWKDPFLVLPTRGIFANSQVEGEFSFNRVERVESIIELSSDK